MLVTIEGIDGSGKSHHISTILRELSRYCDEVILIEKGEQRPIKQFYRNLISNENTFPDKDLALFLRLADPLFIIERYKDIINSKAKILLVYRYVYSYLADNYALSNKNDKSFDLLTYFEDPDLVIYFDLQPEIAYIRKGKVSLAECGGPFFIKEGETHFDAFVRYQSAVREGFFKLFDTIDIPVLNIDSNNPLETVTADMIKKIEMSIKKIINGDPPLGFYK